MKSPLLSFAIMALVFSIGLASAALEVQGIALPTSALHNQDVTVSFTLVNTNSVAYSAVTFTESSTNIGTWKTLPPATALAAGESKNLSGVLNIPLYASGRVNAQVKAKTETNVQATPLSVSFDINNTPALALATVKETTNAQNGTINITNAGNVALNAIEVSAGGNAKVIISTNNAPIAAPFQLNAGASRLVDIAVTDISNLAFGENTLTITARDLAQTAAKATSTFTLRKSFCSAGAKGTNLSISDVEIRNAGEDDDDWKLLDEVTIEVEVDNNGAEDLRDVVVQLGLFDSSGRNVIGKLDFSNEDEEKIEIDKVNDDDSETVTFKFRVAGDIEDGTYKLAVKAYSKRLGESSLCADTSTDLENTLYETITVEQEDDEGKFIAFDEIALSPTEATCGDSVTLSTNVFNIGNEDQDRVKVRVSNAELKIDANQEIRNLDTGDDKSITFSFAIPQEVADKTYTLDFTADYDYGSAGYHETLDTPYHFPLKVFGCAAKPAPQPQNLVSIAADLESDALSGEPMVVKTTLKNTGAQSVTVLVNAKGHESWAKLTDISQRIVTLAPAESKDVRLTFDVNKNATGEQSFTLEVTANDRVQTQQVSVTLQKKDSFWGNLSDNKLAWVIGIINLILIVIIIIVAIKISQR